MTFNDIKTLMESTGADVYHHSSGDNPGDQYIVWAEEREGGSGSADNKKTTRVWQGTIDLFTRTKFDPLKDDIETKLSNSALAWKLNSIQYEEDTEYHHYEWVWEMI